VAIGHPLDERKEDMEPSRERAAVLAEKLHDVRALLRHDHRGFRDDDDREHREHDRNHEHRLLHHASSVSSGDGLTRSVRPSTASIRAAAPGAIGSRPTFTAVQELPRYSTRQLPPGGSSVPIRTSRPTSLSTVPIGRARSFSYRCLRIVNIESTDSTANVSHCIATGRLKTISSAS